MLGDAARVLVPESDRAMARTSFDWQTRHPAGSLRVQRTSDPWTIGSWRYPGRQHENVKPRLGELAVSSISFRPVREAMGTTAFSTMWKGNPVGGHP